MPHVPLATRWFRRRPAGNVDSSNGPTVRTTTSPPGSSARSHSGQSSIVPRCSDASCPRCRPRVAASTAGGGERVDDDGIRDRATQSPTSSWLNPTISRCTSKGNQIRAGQGVAAPATWVLNGTKGACSRYGSMSTRAKPAARTTPSRSRSHEHPSNVHAHGRRSVVAGRAWASQPARRRVRRSGRCLRGAGSAAPRRGHRPGRPRSRARATRSRCRRWSGRSMPSATRSWSSSTTPRRLAAARSRPCMWGLGSTATSGPRPTRSGGWRPRLNRARRSPGAARPRRAACGRAGSTRETGPSG